MEIEEIMCPICKFPYNSNEKIPRLLFKCGHTICQECILIKINLQEKFNLSQSETDSSNLPIFQCQEDNTTYNEVKQFELFPKNVSLLKLITKNEDKRKKNIYTEIHPINSSSNSIVNLNKETKINKEEEDIKQIFSPNLKVNINNSKQTLCENIKALPFHEGTSTHIIDNFRNSLKKLNNNTDNNNPLQISNTSIKYCSLHSTRPLEIICIDHKIKICTNCALFGEHKNHKIINEEDFIKEVEIKAEILMELFELIDTNVNYFKNSENKKGILLEGLLKKSEDKLNCMSSQLNNFTEELIKNIKKKQNSLLENINQKFEKINNKIIAMKEIPNDLIIQSEDWKWIVQNKLDKLNEITENNNLNDEFVKLIDTNITDQEIIKTAEILINEFIKIKKFPINTIEQMIDFNILEMDYELANNLDSLIKLNSHDNKIDNLNEENIEKINEDELLILDEEDKKRINKKNEIIMMSTNSNSIFISNEGDMSAVNNNGINNMNNDNNSFLNLSEDSALIKISSPIIINENNNLKQIINSNSLKSCDKLDSPILISKKSTHFVNNQNVINTIKLPFPPSTIRKDKSRSPKKNYSSVTPDKDKLVFIKNQFKNESANFTGIGINIIKII